MLRNIKGTKDLLPNDTIKWRWIESNIHHIMNSYGYGEIRTPVFENTELFIRGIGNESDIVSKEMYSWIDQSKKSNTPSKFVLHPGGLVYRGRVCYLVCSFDKDLNKIIYLPLHRFKRIEVLDEPSFHANKNIKELSSGLLGFQLSQKKIKVVLKFTMFAEVLIYINL